MQNAENTGKAKLKLRYNKVRPSLNLSIKDCRLKSKSPVFIGHIDFTVEYQGYRLSKLNLDSNYSNLDMKRYKMYQRKNYQVLSLKITALLQRWLVLIKNTKR